MLAAAGFGLAAGTVAAGEDDTGDATFSGEPEVVNSPVTNFFRAVPTAKKYFVPGFNSVSTASCAAPTPPSALRPLRQLLRRESVADPRARFHIRHP